MDLDSGPTADAPVPVGLPNQHVQQPQPPPARKRIVFAKKNIKAGISLFLKGFSFPTDQLQPLNNTTFVGRITSALVYYIKWNAKPSDLLLGLPWGFSIG